MGLDDITKGIKDKVSDTLGDEKKTDDVLDKAENAVNKATGNKLSDQVGKGRDFLDGKVGGKD